MPIMVENRNAIRCDGCGKIIQGEPISVRTCCVNKPKNFCGKQCYLKWRSEWLKNQEQLKRKGAVF